MSRDKLRTTRPRTFHELIGMAGGNEVTLEGSAAALRELAHLLRTEPPPIGIPLWIPDAAPSPYEEYLSAIVRTAGENEKCRITLDCGRLVLEGSDTVLAGVARSLDALSSVEPSPPGTRLAPHLHFDWTSNDMISSDSKQLVISLRTPRGPGAG